MKLQKPAQTLQSNATHLIKHTPAPESTDEGTQAKSLRFWASVPKNIKMEGLLDCCISNDKFSMLQMCLMMELCMTVKRNNQYPICCQTLKLKEQNFEMLSIFLTVLFIFHLLVTKYWVEMGY